MDTLPFEVLSEIFRIFVHELAQPPELVSGINKYLRGVALGNPLLWNDIFWEPVSTRSPLRVSIQEERAIAHLDRSENTPTDLELRLTGDFLVDDGRREAVAKRLREWMVCVRSLVIEREEDLGQIEDTSPLLNFLDRLGREAPMLERLTLPTIHALEHKTVPLLITSAYKTLRQLSLTSWLYFPYDLTRFNALESLVWTLVGKTYVISPPEELFRYRALADLSLLPALKALKIDEHSLSAWFAVPPSSTVVIFPALRRLEIVSKDLLILPYLSCPLVEEVYLGPWGLANRTSFDCICRFLENHRSSIKRLSLPNIVDREDDEEENTISINFPELFEFQACLHYESRTDVWRLIQANALRYLTLTLVKIDAGLLRSFVAQSSATLESITIHSHVYGPYETPRSPSIGEGFETMLDLPKLRMYHSSCRAGDILFEAITTAPALEALHLNGELVSDDFPVSPPGEALSKRIVNNLYLRFNIRAVV